MIALWRGDLPLGLAFWTWSLLWGTVLNFAAFVTKLFLVVQGAPGGLALLVGALPIPFVIACAVGVLRSADRYEGPALEAHLARAAIVVWAGVMLVI